MQWKPMCIDCRYFEPEHHANDDQRPDLVEGEYRREPPQLGEILIDRHGETFRHFGEWPKVLGCDWCGAYQPTVRATEAQQEATRTPPLAPVATGEKTGSSLPPQSGGDRDQRGRKGKINRVQLGTS